MSAMLAEYGMFLAKLFTVVVAVALLYGFMVAMLRTGGGEGLLVQRLNEHYERMRDTVQRATQVRTGWRRRLPWRARQMPREDEFKPPKDASDARGRIFVLDFKGDLRASATEGLRQEISAILSAARDGDRVLLRLENQGGTVHEHGLAASQLARLKAAGIPLTVAVDKVAASGGYLMAAVADRIVAAPFAILGSIGVVAQLPNVHRWMEARGVDFEILTAGRHKRTLTVFGKNTDEGREKLQEQLEDVHDLFMSEVGRHRAQLDVEAVATGEAWYGARALELKLVDELQTSDDLLLAASRDHDLLHVRYFWSRPFPERIAMRVAGSWQRLVDALAQSAWERRYFR